MAHIYPRRLQPEAKSQAERRLYELFADVLPDEYTVFHSVRWLVRDLRSGARDGEADFVIAHPDRGILVLEVKGGHVRYDGVEGQWYSNAVAIKDPFVQAEGNKHSLLDKLKAIPGWGERWLTMGHAVAFPDGVVYEDLRLDAPRAIILDTNDLADVRAWTERAFAYYAPGDRRSSGLGPRSMRTLIDLLAPSTEIHSAMGAAFAAETERIIQLTEEQFRLLDFLALQRRVAIAGCAGSGKTMLALEQARRLTRQGFRVLLSCYNVALASYLRRLVDPSPSCDIENFHGVCQRLAGQAEVLPRARTGEDYYRRLLPEALFEAACRLGPQYDAVVVDEGQDFQADWWLPLQSLLQDPDHGIFYVFHDDNQNLYQTDQRLPAGLQRFVLSRNCRNTQRIHRAFVPFYRSSVLPDAIGPEGRRPQTIFYRDEPEMKRSLAQVIHQLIAEEKVPPADIVVLTPRTPDRSCLAGWQRIGNLQLTTQAPPGPNQLHYTSIYQFKGLESPVVILAEFRPAQVQDADALLYVGCSRARNHLVILTDDSLPEEIKGRLPEP